MSKLGVLLMAISLIEGSAFGQDLSWKEMADLPRSVAGYMAGVVNGKLLIVGGTYWEDKQKHWSDLVQVYDPATNQWTNDTPLPMPRSDAASAVLKNDLYLFGGGSGNDVRKDGLVLHQGKWSPVANADLPEPRQFAGAIASGGYIYVLGGVPGSNYGTVAATFWRWKPNMKEWEVLPPLPGLGRISMAMAEIEGKIYVFGGATTGPKDVQNLSDAYRYDPGKRSWVSLPDLGIANRAWWAVGVGSRALILGGYTNDFAADVYIYENNSLKKTSPLLHPLADAKFFRIGNKIIGAGGEAAPGIRGKWTMEAEIPAGMDNK